MAKEKVLILGGGFGGVKAALELCGDEHFQVTLLTNHPDLRYYPTLYHTATGGKRANSSVSLKTIFEGRSAEVVMGEATTLDRKAKAVATDKGKAYPYDILIIALGNVTNYFGIPGLQEFSYGIKTNTEAERLKNHLHQQLADDKRPDLHYVIVGAGPTGIELAGALKPYLEAIVKKHGIRHRAINIDLVEAAPRLLPRMTKRTSRVVQRRLSRLGIKLMLNQKVEGETADNLVVSGQPLASHTVIWTAGVTNHPFFADNKFTLMPRGKVATDVYLQAEDNIFVLGDNANTPYSGLAQTALYDGVFVADNLKRRAQGKKFQSYNPKIPITVIPCGPHWAAVEYGDIHIYGWLGWLLREAADLVAFHDYESWPTATRQWMTEFAAQDDCPTCTPVGK
jgi:NADH dehydrogenase